jgi:hypothetical protein
MAKFVNHGTLLRYYQQQQEAKGFEHLSHSEAIDQYSVGSDANRIPDRSHHLWHIYDGLHSRIPTVNARSLRDPNCLLARALPQFSTR